MPDLDQAIEYRIGFLDEATGGIQNIDEEFTAVEDHLDEMVTSMDDMAKQADITSMEYRAAIEGMTDIKPELTELPPIEQKIKPEIVEPEKIAPARTPEPYVSPMDEKQLGFFDEMKKSFSNFGKLLGPVTKLITAFAGLSIIMKALSPIFEVLGFFLDLILEPFRDLFYNLIMQIMPVVSAFLVQLYDLIDELLPVLIPVIKELIPVFMGIATTIMNFIRTSLVPVVLWLTKVFSELVKWEGILPSIITLIGGALAFVIGKKLVISVVSAVTSLYQFGVTLITTVIPAIFSAISSLISFGITLITTVIPAIFSAIAAVGAFTLALLANPVTWIVLGLAGLVAILWKVVGGWEGVKEIFSSVWGGLRSFSSWVAGFFETILKGFTPITAAIDLFGLSWEGVKNIISSVWDSIVGLFIGSFDFIKSLIDWIPGIDFEVGKIGVSTEQVSRSIESIPIKQHEVGTESYKVEGPIASGKYGVIQKIYPVTTTGIVGPVIAEKTLEKQLDIVTPLLGGLGRLGDRVVRAIDDQRNYTANISDRLRRLGAFLE